MAILNKDEVFSEKEKIIKEIKEGAVFIHPTDTIYGIGCNAQDSKCVKKIRKIKNRPNQPFSIIAPSKEWIKKNCVVDKKAEEWIDKLPGPYTLIMPLKNQKAISEHVILGLKNIGIRMPNHWIKEIVSELNTPIITTSANIPGEEFMTEIDDLHLEIKYKVDFLMYEGKKEGKPSKIVHLDKNKIIER